MQNFFKRFFLFSFILIVMMNFFLNVVFSENRKKNNDKGKLFLDFTADVDDLKKDKKEGVEYNVKNIEGIKDEAIRIEFDFKSPPGFCEVYLPTDLIPGDGGEFIFYARGKSGNNMLELKLEDEDKTTFIAKIGLRDLTSDKWIEKRVKFDAFRYAWGGKNRILEGKVKVVFAIACGPGGKGYVEFDDMYYKSYPVNPELQLSQVGFHPEDKKKIILRVYGDKVKKNKIPKEVLYEIIEEKSKITVLSKKLDLSDFTFWKGFYYVDEFSELNTIGAYVVKAVFKYEGKDYKLRSYPFKIDNLIYAKEIGASQWNFLNRMKCNVTCHLQDPVGYGFHDTLDDIGKRMWSHTHLVYGISQYASISPIKQNKDDDAKRKIPDSIKELKWAVRFCIDITSKDGSVPWDGVAHKMKWEDYCSKILPLIDYSLDKEPRYKGKNASILATAYNVVGLVNAAKVLKKYDKKLAKKALITAKKCWAYINKKGMTSSTDLGGYIYASFELYKYTKSKKYLEKVKRMAKKLLRMQYNDYHNVEDNICGDFFYSRKDKHFGMGYKMAIHNIGLYLALVEMSKHYKITDPFWWDVYYAAKVFMENYILKMSSKTPYKQIAYGLDQEKDNKWHVYYFSGKSLGAHKAAAPTHGLNCDHYGYGLIAMKWGQYKNDLRYEEFADNQFQWVVGQNPLGYNMISKIGGKQPDIMSSHNGKGPILGGIPNGITDYTGKHPEWWGDGAASGEYWLPHNCYLLALMPILDQKAVLSGIIKNGKKTLKKVKVSVLLDGKGIAKTKTDRKGKFGPLKLVPQKEYVIEIDLKKNKIQRKISLLSGDKENFKINVNSVDISIEMPEKLQANKETEALVTFNNNGIGEKIVLLEVFIKGGVINSDLPKKVKVKSKENQEIKLKIIPDGKMPLVVRVQDMSDDLSYDELLRLPSK